MQNPLQERSVNRDYLIAFQKSSNALVEAIAAEKIEFWYARKGRRVHINWNLASDIATKREFDLIDTYGTKWEVKWDKIARTTGRVFIEECWAATSHADMALIFIDPFGFILPRLDLLAIPSTGEARGGDYDLARGHYISLPTLESVADII
jgi:hypothetical protein